MSDRVALVLHLEPGPTLDDEGIATWWAGAGAPLIEALAETGLPLGVSLAGPLLGWLADTRPDDHAALATLVASGQVELVTTPFHGPVVSAVPMDDFTDQVLSHLTLVRRLYEVRPTGAWLPRQVWDPVVPRVMGRADVSWVPVDDGAIAAHHQHPGLDPWGAFRTEREGHPLTLLANDAGAQALRGVASPEEVVVYLRGRHSQGAHDVVMSWEAVRSGQSPAVEMRWIIGVIRALSSPGNGMEVQAPSRVASRVRSRIYLPSWAPGGATPWERRILERPAADRLHKRMLRVSRLLTRLTKRVRRNDPDAPDPDQLLQARRYLHRAQSAAHYEAPGIDDPQLRHRGWRDLLRAEDVAERAAGTWRRLTAELVDLTTGGTEQVYLRTSSWVLSVDPRIDGGCSEVGFLPGAMNIIDPDVGQSGADMVTGAFADAFLSEGSPVAGVMSSGVPYEVQAVERSGDASVRAMMSRTVDVDTAEGPRQVSVHKGYDVRVDERIDVAVEVHAAGPEGAPLRSRLVMRVPIVVGTPFDDLMIQVDDQTKAIGEQGVDVTDVRHVDLVGETLAVRLAIKERGRVWIQPMALGAVLWVDWPIEVFSSAPKRLRLRLSARRVEQIDEASGGVPMRVLEEGPKIGDTVVLQRSVPVPAPQSPAHASVAPAAVDKVSRALNLVPPRGPVGRPQRLPLWAPPSQVEPPTDPTDPVDPMEAPVVPERDDAGTASTEEEE